MTATSFKDTARRRWIVRFSIGDVRRVESLTGVCLGALDGAGFIALAGDPVALSQVLAALIAPQLRAARVSNLAFAEALDGDTLEAAGNALAAAILEFLPEPQPAPAKKPTPEKGTPSERFWRAVHRAAGITGIDPDGMTFRAILDAAEARMNHDGNLSAWIAFHVMRASVPKFKSNPSEMHPYRKASSVVEKTIRAPFRAMRSIFCGW